MSVFPIFIALVLDILAFTVILPLYPRLFNEYHQQWLAGNDDFYGWCLEWITSWKNMINLPQHLANARHLDIVLMGGVSGSLFAMLQFISSPLIGKLSDKWGRKTTLLLTMIGNIASAALWIFSSTFSLFILSRVVGGLSEGNVQLSIAMITDITTEKTRSKGLALVGMAFALGFTFGPAIGAWTSSIDLNRLFPSVSQLTGWEINEFSTVAFLCMTLLVVETVYIMIFVSETLPSRNKRNTSSDTTVADTTAETTLIPKSRSSSRLQNRSKKAKEENINQTAKKDINQNTSHAKSLKTVMFSNGLFLFFFSGMEFTLTFLTFDRFKYTNMQQGKLLGLIGILSSLIQGGYVRRFANKIGEDRIVKQGLVSCIVCSFSLAVVGTAWDPFRYQPMITLGISAVSLAIASGTVVNGLTAMYSIIQEKHHASTEGENEKQGEKMGYMRSVGQLGRALGPLAFCSIYWLTGGLISYSISALGVFIVLLIFNQHSIIKH